MAKVKISKQLIEMIANKDNSEFVKNINEKVNQLLALSIENLAKKVSYISLDNVVLQPINETFNNAFVDGSYYAYLLGIENAQLQLNTIRKEGFWKGFKKKFVYFWKNRKLFKKKKKHRRKKKNEKVENLDIKNIDKTKYTIYDLTEDLQQSLSYFLSESSMIYANKNALQIVGKDDFGPNVKILIYVVSLESQVYKHFLSHKKGFLDINLPNRLNFLGEKQQGAGENFVKMMKVLNALYFNVNGNVPNQVFLESILCSCPDELFQGNDIFKVYLKIINFLSIKTIRRIKSINDTTKTIHEDIVCGNCGISFNKMLSELGKEKI